MLPVLENVRLRAENSVKSRQETEKNFSLAENAMEKAAKEKLQATENKISELEAFLEKDKNSANEELKTQAKAQIDEAKNLTAQAKTKIENKEYKEAFTTLQKAMRLAQEAKLIVLAQKGLKIRLTLPVIEIEKKQNIDWQNPTTTKENTASSTQNHDRNLKNLQNPVKPEGNLELRLAL